MEISKLIKVRTCKLCGRRWRILEQQRCPGCNLPAGLYTYTKDRPVLDSFPEIDFVIRWQVYKYEQVHGKNTYGFEPI